MKVSAKETAYLDAIGAVRREHASWYATSGWVVLHVQKVRSGWWHATSDTIDPDMLGWGRSPDVAISRLMKWVNIRASACTEASKRIGSLLERAKF